MKKKSVKVELAPRSNISPIRSACFAALCCYMARFPKWGKVIDWFGKLFKTGHHTTFMHAASYFSFIIDGISVGDVTFGLHLTHPFYNTSQRSGRYCSSMFVRFIKRVKNSLKLHLMKYFPQYIPDLEVDSSNVDNSDKKFKAIEQYIRDFWPDLSEEKISLVMDYVCSGVEMFQSNIEKATIVAADFARKERPNATAEYLAESAPKFAQEQMRNSIPIIVPTGMVYTVNLITLIALWESAWTPPMKYVTDEMVRLVLDKYPALAPMFDKKNRRKDEWAIVPSDYSASMIVTEPFEKILSIEGAEKFVMPKYSDRHPVDKLHFTPELMDNSIGDIKSRVEISVATMGQDQRHRTISRGKPRFTGAFYLPPILKEIGMENQAMSLLTKWKAVVSEVPATLAMILAPYGAVVSYEKRGSFLAVDHEKGKRTCFCAQEEIYWCGVQSRMGVEEKLGSNHPLLGIFEPPCYRSGKCAEGGRYCGRDIITRKKGDYFPRRSI